MQEVKCRVNHKIYTLRCNDEDFDKYKAFAGLLERIIEMENRSDIKLEPDELLLKIALERIGWGEVSDINRYIHEFAEILNVINKRISDIRKD